MATFVAFNYPALGHIHPTLAVYEELIRRGHHVISSSTAHLAPMMSSTGATPLVYDSAMGAYFQSSFSMESRSKIPDLGLTDAERLMKAAENQLNPADVDVVLQDTDSLAGRLYTHKHQKPAVRLFPTYASNASFSLAARFPFYVPPTEQEQAARDSRKAEVLQQFDIADPPAEVTSKPADLNLVFVDEQFHYERSSFDDQYVFVGPCLRDRAVFQGNWRPQQSGLGLKRVLVSLGTATTGWPEFFSMAVEGLAQEGWHVVLATGSNVAPHELGPLPASVEAHQRVPQLDVLPHVDVFVTHGGMNSVMEALYFGVPMVVVPQMGEQTASATRVAELNLGRHLPKNETTSSALREATAEVVSDPMVATAVTEFSTRMQAVDGTTTAANAIEALLAEQAT